MPKKKHPRNPADVVQITRDSEILTRVDVSYDADENPLVKAIWIVPDPDGTMRKSARISSVDPEVFLTAVFEDTKR